MKGYKVMHKIKSKLKNIIYSIGFLFRPIIPVAVSLVFLVISSALLVLLLLNLDESTKAYQVLLAILTGITASLLIAIMMELYNNYRFNVKRQRELREFFRNVASYEINISSIIKSNTKYGSTLGRGRSYAVFYQLNKIIPSLREVLNSRDYLYPAEIEAIDDILYDYDDMINRIWIGLLNTFMGLLSDEVESEPKEEQKVPPTGQESFDEAAPIDETDLNIELLNDYPSLLKFVEKEARRYDKREKDSTFYDEASKHLKYIIEKAIFYERNVFEGYFEVTDVRHELTKTKATEEELENEPLDENRRYEFRSNGISEACGNIDEAMMKLQRRVAKEPYYWVMANYKEKNK